VEIEVMTAVEMLQKRVSDLEEQVERLNQSVFSGDSSKPPSKPGWVHKLVGSFEDDADFAEIVRLGKEIRDAEDPA
jgi:hypothetical protein